MDKKGQTISVYVSKETLPAYRKLQKQADLLGKSVSEFICTGMEYVVLGQECGVTITPGAFFAMQDGRFDLLTRTRLVDTTLIGLTEEGYASGYDDKVQKFRDEKNGN